MKIIEKLKTKIKDTARLDWLSRNVVSISSHTGSPQGDGDIYVCGKSYRGESLREVIDAAMKEIK